MDGLNWINRLNRMDRLNWINRLNRMDRLNWINTSNRMNQAHWINDVYESNGIDGINPINGINGINSIETNPMTSILSPFFIVVLVALIIILIAYFSTKIIKIKRENDSLNASLFNFNSRVEKLLAEKDELNRLVNETNLNLNDRNETIIELTNKLNNLNELISKYAAIEDIDRRLNELNELLRGLDSKVNDKVSELEQLNNNLNCARDKLVEVEDQNRIRSKELAELSERYGVALSFVEKDGNGGWSIEPEAKNGRLVDLIHELVDEYGTAYPVLGKELLKIEWSVVWLPVVQRLCVREGLERSGIYRLRLKENETVCYVGQAVNIKDRWYTHIKKMLGVEGKGNERLYEYRPNDFLWEVVEFKDGDLDEAESYWIEYFRCREVGLNKKR